MRKKERYYSDFITVYDKKMNVVYNGTLKKCKYNKYEYEIIEDDFDGITGQHLIEAKLYE